MGDLLSALRRERVSEVVMIGKLEKRQVMRGGGGDTWMKEWLGRVRDLKDTSLLAAFAALLKEQGLSLLSPDRYLNGWLAPSGVMTSRRPRAEEAEDLRYGVRMARQLGQLDIGQAVVVKRGSVVAVEGWEGTDRMIRRAGTLASGGTVVKVSRPGQDLTLDPPAVGCGTLRAMKQAGSRCLGVEAGRTIMVDLEAMIRCANRWHMSIVGL